MKKELIQKFINKKAVIGIIGQGYVGLPLSIRFIEAGYQVIGFEIDKSKVENIQKGVSYIKHIEFNETVKKSIKEGLFEATTDFSLDSQPDALIICVPNPLGKHYYPDMSYVENSFNSLLPYLRKGQLLSMESTTYPGTTDEIFFPKIVEKGFKIGKDFFLVYSPEREDPGNINFTTQTIPKVVGGYTSECLEVGQSMYKQVIDKIVTVSSTKAAELTKLLENIYRSVNIGLINEIKIVADKMGIDIWEVIEAASSKPFGFSPFYPGPGLGGHCIPIDPFYLTWKAREFGLHTHFIELAGEINTNMPQFVVNKISYALNDRKKSIHGSNILVIGLSYKKNIDDLRESPAIEIIKLLFERGADVSYSDPFIPEFIDHENPNIKLKSIELKKESISAYDCVVIVTDHDAFDYQMIQKNSQLVVDTRGRLRGKYDNVIPS